MADFRLDLVEEKLNGEKYDRTCSFLPEYLLNTTEDVDIERKMHVLGELVVLALNAVLRIPKGRVVAKVVGRTFLDNASSSGLHMVMKEFVAFNR